MGAGSNAPQARRFAVSTHGVRGGAPTPGRARAVYGGHTLCLEVEIAGRRIVIDAGSGLHAVAGGKDRRTNILLTHLHLDHLIGLFAFDPLYEAGAEIVVWCGNLGGATAETELRRLFSTPLFPGSFDDLRANLVFKGFVAGETIQVDGVSVRTHPLRHPGGATGYRFEDSGRIIVVATDMEHDDGGPEAGLVAFCRHADAILYDATYKQADYPRYRGWGHSTHAEGVRLARAASAKRLVCLHHAPQYDDAELRAAEADVKALWPGASLARDGDVIVIG